jgi:hypothetical protein
VKTWPHYGSQAAPYQKARGRVAVTSSG